MPALSGGIECNLAATSFPVLFQGEQQRVEAHCNLPSKIVSFFAPGTE